MKFKIFSLIERLGIIHVLLIWFFVGLLFSFFYFFLPGITTQSGIEIKNFFDAVYFSFVTLLTIGYGDIIPIGMAKIFIVIEGLIGWILFGLIVYKIVSVKEDIIIGEIHSMAIDEYISRLRHYLFVSRTNLSRLLNNITTKKRVELSDLFELGVISTTLEANISDAKNFLCQRGKGHSFIKEIRQEDVLFIADLINLNLFHFIDILQTLSKKVKMDNALLEGNIRKILSHISEICGVYESKIVDEKISEMKKNGRELAKFI